MSTVATIFTRNEAVVAADTARLWISGTGAQADGHASKLLPLPHMNAVLAGVGHLGVLTGAFHLLADLPYDDILDAGPAFAEGFEGITREGQSHLLDIEMPEIWRQRAEAGEYYAMLVGWSHKDQEVVCFYFAAPNGPWGRESLSGCLAFPPGHDESMESVVRSYQQATPTAGNATSLINDLRRPFSSEYLESVACGGHLTVVTLRKGQLLTEIKRDAFG